MESFRGVCVSVRRSAAPRALAWGWVVKLAQGASRSPGSQPACPDALVLQDKPVARSCLNTGDTVTGFRELHTIEGSLKSDARRDGRFLTGGLVGGSGSQDFALNCVLETGRCDFYVKFNRLVDMKDGEARWKCVEIRGKHTCVSTAAAAGKKLEWRLSFFVRPALSHCAFCLLVVCR